MHVPLPITSLRFVSAVTSMLKMLRRQPNQIDIPHVVIASQKSMQKFARPEILFLLRPFTLVACRTDGTCLWDGYWGTLKTRTMGACYDAILLSDLSPHRNTKIASAPIMTKPSKIPMLLKFPANKVRVALTAYENGLIFAMS